MIKPDKQDSNRNEDGTFRKGVSGNLKGRPPGKSLKEFWKQRFAEMTDEEKLDFSMNCSPGLLFRMAEGNPANETDLTSDHKPIIFQISKEIADKNNVDSTQSTKEDS